MTKSLQQLQLTVCSLGQDRCRKGFHNLLDCHVHSSQLIFGRAILKYMSISCLLTRDHLYQTRPKAPMPTGCKSTYLFNLVFLFFFPLNNHYYLVVTSKTVPKIDNFTNSAIFYIKEKERQTDKKRKNTTKIWNHVLWNLT